MIQTYKYMDQLVQATLPNAPFKEMEEAKTAFINEIEYPFQIASFSISKKTTDLLEQIDYMVRSKTISNEDKEATDKLVIQIGSSN